MVITCAREGLRAAWRRPGLVALLWAWNVLTAAVVAWPAWTWWTRATARAPEADVLLSRFRFNVFMELVRNDSSIAVLFQLFLVVAALALIGQALVADGSIEILTATDERPFLHRFFRGAGHFFWRFLRAAIVSGVVFIAGVVALVLAFRPIGRALEEINWEPAWYLGYAALLMILAFVALVVVLAIDYARIRMVLDDARGSVRALAGAMRLVLTRPRPAIGVWLVMALASAVVFAIYYTVCAAVPTRTWAPILAMALVQQLTVLARAGLRVALVASQVEVWRRLRSAQTPAVETPLLPLPFDEADAATPPA
jgi:hypothetical protein